MVALMGTVGHVGDIGGSKDSLARPRDLRRRHPDPADVCSTAPASPTKPCSSCSHENVRKPEEVLGDVHSFVAANQLGADRLLAFMEEYGMHDLRALAAVVQNRAEAAMREAIRALPDGTYHAEPPTTRSAPRCATR